MIAVCIVLCTAPKATATASRTPNSTVYWRQVLEPGRPLSSLSTDSALHTYRLLLLRSKIHSRLHLLSPQNKQRQATELTSNAEFYFHVTHVWWTLLLQRHCYNNAIRATLFVATWHSEVFSLFLNENHTHRETHLTPGWNKICCFETSADSSRLQGAKSRKQEYETTSHRKPKIVHTASTVGCNTTVPLWFRVCCDTACLSLSL